LTVGIEACGVQRYPPLEVPIVADPRSASVPPVAEHVLESVAVTRAVNKPAGLVANRIVRRIGEGSQRIAAGIDARGVDVVFGAGGAVLQVVSPVVLRHPRAFDVWIHSSVAVILPEPLPAVVLWIQPKQPARSSLVSEP